jgi:hypothetical protein
VATVSARALIFANAPVRKENKKSLCELLLADD